MAERQAKIKVGVEGAEEAAADARKVKDAWVKAGGDTAKAFQSAGNAIADATAGMISDLVRVATVAQGISFAKGVAEARAYQETIGRMSVVARASVGDLRQSFEFLSKKTLEPEKNIVSFTDKVRRLTYDARGAAQAFSGIADEALATGKSTDELAPLATLLHNTLGITGDTADALGRMRSQADAFGTVGGPAALHDTLVGVSGVLDQLSAKGDNASGKITSLVAGLGKGYKPEQQKGVVNSILGTVESNPFGFGKYFLGKQYDQFLDQQGNIKDPIEYLAAIQKKAKERFGKQFLQKSIMTFGTQAGYAFANADFDEIRKNAELGPSKEAGKIADSFRQSETGEMLRKQQAKDRAERKTGEALNPIATATQGFIAENPILGTLGLGIGGSLFGKAVGSGLRGLTGLVGNALWGGGGAAAAEGATTAAAGGTAAAAEGTTALSGLAANGAELIGGAGAGTAALGAGVMGLGLVGALKVLTEVGQDRTEMGKDWLSRPEIRDVFNKENALKPQPTFSDFDRQVAFSKSLQEQGIPSDEAAAMAKDAAEHGTLPQAPPLQITVINQTGGPIQVIDGQKQGTAKQ